MSLDPRVIKESFAAIEPHGDKVAARFYGRLFAENPRLRTLFPAAMDLQRDRLLGALARIVWSLDSTDELTGYLRRLGRDHRKYGVRPEDFAAVGAALIATFRELAGPAWTPEAEAAWSAAYATVAGVMSEAITEAAETTPPWWIAQVVRHERRGPDLAVLSLRPNQPFRYEAGQYVTVQVSRWPRVWRPFSLAAAPHPDGLLRLHVRAVPGGWVSGALVRYTGIGDTVLLGPAQGTMTLDPRCGRDLLLAAGGTGLAPLKALAEQAHLDRKVHLVVGARTRQDLYDLADLQRLAAARPGLTITPVLSDEPGPGGLRAPLPDVLPDLGDWSEHEAYVAGPPKMIGATVHQLHALGLPLDRIHHDMAAWDGDHDWPAAPFPATAGKASETNPPGTADMPGMAGSPESADMAGVASPHTTGGKADGTGPHATGGVAGLAGRQVSAGLADGGGVVARGESDVLGHPADPGPSAAARRRNSAVPLSPG